MSLKSQVVVKFPADTREVIVDFAEFLVNGETIISGAITLISPSTLVVTSGSVIGATVPLSIGAGTDGQSYGVSLAVNTDAGHTYIKKIAVVVNSQLGYEYQTQNVGAFAQVVGELEAGQAGLGQAHFMFPVGFKAVGGFIRWTLLDQTGVTYASGQSFDYEATVLSDAVRVDAQAVVSTPSDMLPTLSGQSYQIRWETSNRWSVFLLL